MARFFLARCTVVVVSIVATTTLVTPAFAAPPDAWPQRGHDAGQSYANLGESQLTVAALKAMPPWPGMARSTVDVGLLDVTDPLIEGDSMVVTSISWDGENGRLERFDLPTGQRLWTDELWCPGPPNMSAGLIVIAYFCSETNPPPAHVL